MPMRSKALNVTWPGVEDRQRFHLWARNYWMTNQLLGNECSSNSVNVSCPSSGDTMFMSAAHLRYYFWIHNQSVVTLQRLRPWKTMQQLNNYNMRNGGWQTRTRICRAMFCFFTPGSVFISALDGLNYNDSAALKSYISSRLGTYLNTWKCSQKHRITKNGLSRVRSDVRIRVKPNNYSHNSG